MNTRSLKLSAPFAISARLAPAVQIGAAWLSFVDGQFVIDLPDGSEHRIADFHFPRCAVRGVNDTPESMLQEGFASILAFLSACAESRDYGERTKGDPMAGENSDLFPSNVGEWAQANSDAIDLARLEIEETPGAIARG